MHSPGSMHLTGKTTALGSPGSSQPCASASRCSGIICCCISELLLTIREGKWNTPGFLRQQGTDRASAFVVTTSTSSISRWPQQHPNCWSCIAVRAACKCRIKKQGCTFTHSCACLLFPARFFLLFPIFNTIYDIWYFHYSLGSVNE